MFFIFKQNKLLYEKILEFTSAVLLTVKDFQKAIKRFSKEENHSELEVNMQEIHKHEHKADIILGDIRTLFYKKSLLPESREDILVLLEKIDDIADSANHIIHDIYAQNISLPKFILEDYKELVKATVSICETLESAVIDLFNKRKEIPDRYEKIRNYESICDILQTKMVKSVFDSDMNNFNKILLRDIIKSTGGLSDTCEMAADLIMILYIKRFI